MSIENNKSFHKDCVELIENAQMICNDLIDPVQNKSTFFAESPQKDGVEDFFENANSVTNFLELKISDLKNFYQEQYNEISKTSKYECDDFVTWTKEECFKLVVTAKDEQSNLVETVVKKFKKLVDSIKKNVLELNDPGKGFSLGATLRLT